MWPSLVIVTLLAAIAQGVAGFGFTLLSVSFYLLILRSTNAVQLILLMNFAIAVVLVGRLWRDIPGRLWALLAGGGVLGFPAGLWLFARADVALIEIAIAAVTIAFALLVLRTEVRRGTGRDIPRGGETTFRAGSALSVGVCAGALTSSLGAPGPPVAIYLSALGLDKTTFRALAQGTFIVMQIGSIAGQAYTVGIGSGVWQQALVLAPVAALGSAIGHRLSHRVSERDFRRAVLLLLLATGAYMLVHGLFGGAAAEAASQDAWSPDGATFVYTSQASGNADLWLTRPGGEPIALTDDPAQDHWASWFPDGERLAFQTLRDGNREVYVMDAAGGGVVNLTNHPAQDLLPEVSPDGTRIVFFSDRGIEHGPRELPGHLYVMDVDGGNVERLTEEPLTSTFFASWSPDGRTLVFARDFAGDVDLVLLDIETRRERRIRGTPASESAGRFSPDGSAIACNAAAENGESRIVLLDVDGSDRRELTGGAQHYQPAWSPDGRWLIFTAAPLGATQFDIMVVPAGGGPVRPLLATGVDERTASWRPSASRQR